MDLLATKDVAVPLNISKVRVFQLITEGALPAQQIGRDCFVTELDLIEYEKIRREAGRPKVKKNSVETK